MDMNYLGDILLQYRQKRKMTQEEFASRLGVTPQAVSKWERGASLPDVSLLADICKILNINANELLNIEKNISIVESKDTVAEREIKNNMFAEPIKVIFGSDLIPIFVQGLMTNLIDEKRKELVAKTGILLPIIRIRDDIELSANEYQIISYDKILYQNKLEVIDEDTYGKVVSEMIDLCAKNYDLIMNKQIVKILIDNMKEMYPGVVDDFIPEKVPYIIVQKVLVELVKRTGNIRNMIRIIEIIEEEFIVRKDIDISSVVELIINS